MIYSSFPAAISDQVIIWAPISFITGLDTAFTSTAFADENQRNDLCVFRSYVQQVPHLHHLGLLLYHMSANSITNAIVRRQIFHR